MSYKAGFVGVVGAPNMGKSSLVNQIVGEKVSIVTDKPQTTRKSKVGIYSDDTMQALFVDAPGFIKAEKGLNKYLQDEAGSVIDSADILVYVVTTEASNLKFIEKSLEKLSERKKPWFVVINKMDSNLSRRVLILEDLIKKYDVPYFKHSTLEDDYNKTDLILGEVRKLLPDSKGPLYDTDGFTTSLTRDWVSEIIREKCFEMLEQELPFNLAVKVQKFQESNAKECIKIYTDIIVTKKNHCPIVIGKGGSKIKRIGSEARKEIEGLLGEKVYLQLFTKVKDSWSTNKSFMKELGYVVNDK